MSDEDTIQPDPRRCRLVTAHLPCRRKKDPVCGMAVDPRSGAAAAVRAGTRYYFCSASCRDKLKQTPQQNVGTSAPVAYQG